MSDGRTGDPYYRALRDYVLSDVPPIGEGLPPLRRRDRLLLVGGWLYRRRPEVRAWEEPTWKVALLNESMRPEPGMSRCTREAPCPERNDQHVLVWGECWHVERTTT